MFYRRYLSTLFGRGLSTLFYPVTYRCNANCRMCYAHDRLNKDGSDELTLDEIRSVCRNLKGLALLQCTGGEPFLREDLFDLLDCFASIADAINITTNGLLPERTEQTISGLVRKNKDTLFRLVLGIDGFREAHDHTRGCGGAFGLLVETYGRVRKIREKNRNLLVSFNTVFTRENADSVSEVIDFVGGLDADGHTLTYVWGRPRVAGLADPPVESYKRALSYAHLKSRVRRRPDGRLARWLLDVVTRVSDNAMIDILEKKRMIFPCRAVRRFALMLPDGAIRACHLRGEDLGNLRDYGYDIRLLLRDDKAERAAKDIADRRCWCTAQCCNRNNIIYNLQALLLLWKNIYIS